MYQRIVDELDQHGVSYTSLTHAPVVTSNEAARERGNDAATGLKCLLLKSDTDFVLAVLPGSAKLDSRALRRVTESRDVRFADPDDVRERMGCEVGACYPLGNLIRTRTIFDSDIAECEDVVFNAGLHDTSIRMRARDLMALVDPDVYDVTKKS